MQQIKTVIQNFGSPKNQYDNGSLDRCDKEINELLADGWTILNISTSIYNSEQVDGSFADRAILLVRDLPDATKAQAAPRKSMGITSPHWRPKVGEQVWTETSDDRMVSGVITELVPQKDGFMVQWSDSKLPIPVFETRKSVTDIPF